MQLETICPTSSNEPYTRRSWELFSSGVGQIYLRKIVIEIFAIGSVRYNTWKINTEKKSNLSQDTHIVFDQKILVHISITCGLELQKFSLFERQSKSDKQGYNGTVAVLTKVLKIIFETKRGRATSKI